MKKGMIYKIIFCFINSLIGLYAIKFHYTMMDIFGSVNEVYLDPFTLSDIFTVIMFFVMNYLIITLLDKLISKYKKKETFNISNRKLFTISFIAMLICWAPYYLTFFPGGVFYDTLMSYRLAINTITTGHYSVFYSLYIRVLDFICLGNSTSVFILMTIIQILLFLRTFSYFIVWLKNKKVNKVFIVLSLLFFCLNPRIPIYAVSIWKDSMFSIFLFAYILYVFDIIFHKYKILKDKRNVFIYCLLCILVSLFRNNGYYIIVFMTLFIFYKTYKYIKEYKLFYILSTITVSVIVVTYAIVFRVMKLTPLYIESIGVPIQQIAYVVSTTEDLNPDIKERVTKIISIDNMKYLYKPMNVDKIKFSYSFDSYYIEDHKSEFWELYFKVLKKYPKECLTSFLYSNVGYWNYYTVVFSVGSDSLIDFYDNLMVPIPAEDVTNNVDIIDNVFGFSLNRPLRYIARRINNSAIGFLCMFISIYILIKRDKLKWAIIYMPCFLILIGLLLQAPIAYCSRYIIITIFMMPLFFILPFIEDKK